MRAAEGLEVRGLGLEAELGEGADQGAEQPPHPHAGHRVEVGGSLALAESGQVAVDGGVVPPAALGGGRVALMVTNPLQHYTILQSNKFPGTHKYEFNAPVTYSG